MQFRFWLESDEIHPFQQWHNDYKHAHDADEREYQVNARRDPYSYMVTGRKESHIKSKQLLRDPRYSRQFAVLVLEVTGSSNGSHGRGGSDEISAGNPLEYPNWDIHVKSPEQDAPLIGRPAVICDNSGGSYHERWGRLYVYVLVDDTYADSADYDDGSNLLSYWLIPQDMVKKIKKFFRYEGVEQAKQELINFEPRMSFPPLPGEDREAYWARISNQEAEKWSKPADGYNDRDDYFKK